MEAEKNRGEISAVQVRGMLDYLLDYLLDAGA